jgi:hypothetical protein
MVTDTRGTKGLRFLVFSTLIGLFSLITIAGLPHQAAAQPADLRDRIIGSDVDQVDWTQGSWVDLGAPADTCVTFAGGVTTGPANPSYEETITCSFTPNKWFWSVTIPTGDTIDWSIENLPVGIEVCAQIFYDETQARLSVQLDYAGDWLTVISPTSGFLYDGPYSTFDPGAEGFTVTELQRCGLIQESPVPTLGVTWGKLKQLYQ